MIPLRDNVPTRRAPVVTIAIIVANVLVWLWEWRSGVNQEVARYGYYPCLVEGPCNAFARHWHQIPWYENAFTSMFMHASWIHIGGNMLFLWIFGNNVEDALGRVRFAGWYVLSGLAATAGQTAITLHYSGVAGASVPNIGASGAIAGVLGAYFLMLPRAKVLTAFLIVFIFIREIDAFWFLGAWFAFQLVDGGFALVHPQQGGGIAFFAHVFGFAFGLLTVYAVRKQRPLQPRY